MVSIYTTLLDEAVANIISSSLPVVCSAFNLWAFFIDDSQSSSERSHAGVQLGSDDDFENSLMKNVKVI